MIDNMSLDDMSFADLLHTCQAHLKRPRAEVESSQGKTIGKGRSKNRSDSSTTSSRHEGDSELLMMLAKLSLRQEDILNQMALDRNFLLFLQVGKGSILPAMILASKEWHQQRQNTGVTYSLRQVNFLKVIEALIQRLAKLKFDSQDDPLVQALRQRSILIPEHAWNYLTWDSAAKCLRLTKQPPLTQDKIQEITTQLSQLASQGDLIQRFSALKPMNRDQIPEDSQVTIPWRLDRSLCSAASTQLFEIMNLVSGKGICQLIFFDYDPQACKDPHLLQQSPTVCDA